LSDSLPSSANAPVAEPSAAPPGPSNLQQRIIYGLLGAALLMGSVWLSSWTFNLFFAAVQAIMLWEFYRMMEKGGYAPATKIGVLLSLALFGSGALFLKVTLTSTEQSGAFVFGLGKLLADVAVGFMLLLPLFLLLREMIRWPSHGRPFENVAVTILGMVYVSIPMTLINALAFTESGYDYRRIVGLLLLIWASDIGAYVAGKSFGRHKLAPSISPGKTWEGWAGGALLTLAIGSGLGWLLPDLPLTHRLIAAGVVATFGPLGDLAESMLKRSVGVKDSGRIMPGHGGLLDRFDAFLLVLPVLALLRLIAG
jgi:phosphatidate cytidylyltransferase